MFIQKIMQNDILKGDKKPEDKDEKSKQKQFISREAFYQRFWAAYTYEDLDLNESNNNKGDIQSKSRKLKNEILPNAPT